MSNPGIHKLQHIGLYLVTESVTQPEMQSRYDAALLIQRIIKEIRIGKAIRKQEVEKRRMKGKKK
jgi:hypothetical protein